MAADLWLEIAYNYSISPDDHKVLLCDIMFLAALQYTLFPLPSTTKRD